MNSDQRSMTWVEFRLEVIALRERLKLAEELAEAVRTFTGRQFTTHYHRQDLEDALAAWDKAKEQP